MTKDEPHDWKDIEINIGGRTVKGGVKKGIRRQGGSTHEVWPAGIKVPRSLIKLPRALPPRPREAKKIACIPPVSKNVR
jgi:hypothetical protein